MSSGRHSSEIPRFVGFFKISKAKFAAYAAALMSLPRVILLTLIVTAHCSLHAQFIAFNDHDGWQSVIHPFTTTYSLPDYDPTYLDVVQGRLRNITDGELLNAEVRIQWSGSSSFPYANSNSFAPGTPAALLFGCVGDGPCFADFRDSSARVGGSRMVTHTFLGLNPARKYQFIGTGIGTWPSIGISNDTTRYSITGAVSFVNAHTTNCVLEYMTTNTVIVPTGRNHEPGFGDMAVWNDIRVGTNGSFSVVSGGHYGLGSPINGFRLVEDFIDPTAPFVSSQPANVVASSNSVRSLAPVVRGSLPLTFQWLKDGMPIPDATNRVHYFNPLFASDAGTYWLVVTNPYGTTISSNATVEVLSSTVGIVSQPQSQSLRYGDLLFLSVTATGTPPLFIQWFKDGVALANAQSNTLQVGAADYWNVGSYSALISNYFSFEWSSTATVTVAHTRLRITDQPQSITVTQGTPLRLQVAVAGSAPQFQWYKNGVSIANATNSVFRVNSAVATNAGNYFVVAASVNAVTSSVAVVSVVPPGPPPTPLATVPLLALTNVWAYDQTTGDRGTNWQAVSFNDSTWDHGKGVFAIENNPIVNSLTNTVLVLSNAFGQPIITSYFRTHFFWPYASAGGGLLFSNLIDDGAVFYLNGAPLFRQNMPDGSFNYLTLASAASTEGAFVLTNLAAPTLNEGDNVLAVEVHQNSPTSSDIVFGTAVFGYQIAENPLAIISSPSNAIVMEGLPLTLNFTANAPARFRWYHDGVPVDGSISGSLSFSALQAADAGQYYAIATNSVNAVTSAVAVVQIISDLQPPRILDALVPTNRNNLFVDFNEPLLASTATNPANFRVLLLNGNDAVTVSSATYSNSRVVLSLTPALPSSGNYVLRVNGVIDAAIAANTLNNFETSVRQLVPLIPLVGDWKYNDSGNDLGTAWRSPSYDDSGWSFGPAVFFNGFFGDGNPQPFYPTNTFIPVTNAGVPVITHYFRRHAAITAAPLSSELVLRAIMDDGVVMYVNGSEIFRRGVTNNPVYFTNVASRLVSGVGESTLEGPFTLPPGFVTGDNVVAVELHQLNSTDAFFGAELNLIAKSFPYEPLKIVRQPADVFVQEGQPFTFTVDSLAATSAQWFKGAVAIPGAAAETVFVPRALPGDNGAQFSVLLSNAFGSVLSSNATLHVLADTNAPVLLSADAYESLTEITLTFSEPIDAASAANLAHYLVRGSNGQLLTVTGASVVNETNIVLTTALRTLGKNYEVRVTGLRDTAVAYNEIEPGSGAIAAYSATLVPLTATWRYDQSGNGQVETWKTPGFDDSDWPVGQAMLFNDTFFNGAPMALGTLLSLTNPAGGQVNTHYFRHAFNFPSLEPGAMLSVRHAIDDAAIIYLSNVGEILRTNFLSSAPVDKTTFSIASVGDAALIGPVPVAANPPSGPAVLAAEVHQATAFASDVAFAAELAISRPGTLLAPLGAALRVSRSGNQLQLSWDGNYRLESATSVGGDWNLVTNAASPFVTNAVNTVEFFRLRKP